MARMTRAQLKSIVKECLVEILAEGIAVSPEPIRESRRAQEARPQRETQPEPRRRRRRRSQPREEAPVREGFDNAVERSVGVLTEDPVMAAIFADTARTTLQEQMANETASPAGAMPPAMGALGGGAKPQVPIDIFEGAKDNRWAKLAFADPVPGSQ